MNGDKQLNESILLERLPGLAEVHLFDRLESTNDFGKQLALNDYSVPALIYARQQTRGRGREHKTWISGSGSLTFSLVVNQDLPVDRSPTPVPPPAISWGLAVAESLNLLTRKNVFRVKWPNDVMAFDRKAAGILIKSNASRPRQLVVGIGINVSGESISLNVHQARDGEASEPETSELPRSPITVFEASGVVLSHVELLESIWRQMDRLRELNASQWRDRFARVDYLTGKKVSLKQGSRIHRGLYLGIGPAGEMKVQTQSGIESFFSGSVIEIHGS